MRTTISRRSGELVVGLSLLAVAVYVVGTTATTLPLGSLSDPGAGLFPMAIAAFLGVTAIGLVLQARPAATGGEKVDMGGAHLLITAAALAGFLWSWNSLGFLLGESVFLALLFQVLGGLSWMAAILAGIVAGTALWAGFTIVLGVMLPAGLIG